MPIAFYCDGCGKRFAIEQFVTHQVTASARGESEIYCRDCDGVLKQWKKEEHRLSLEAAQEFQARSGALKQEFFKARIPKMGDEPTIDEEIDLGGSGDVTLGHQPSSPPNSKKGKGRGRPFPH